MTTKRTSEPNSEAEEPLDDFLDQTSGRAFAAGFQLGFEAAKAGASELALKEIEKRFYEALQDTVFAIREGPGGSSK